MSETLEAFSAQLDIIITEPKKCVGEENAKFLLVTRTEKYQSGLNAFFTKYKFF